MHDLNLKIIEEAPCGGVWNAGRQLLDALSCKKKKKKKKSLDTRLMHQSLVSLVFQQ